jgi:hypothetical protein
LVSVEAICTFRSTQAAVRRGRRKEKGGKILMALHFVALMRRGARGGSNKVIGIEEDLPE